MLTVSRLIAVLPGCRPVNNCRNVGNATGLKVNSPSLRNLRTRWSMVACGTLRRLQSARRSCFVGGAPIDFQFMTFEKAHTISQFDETELSKHLIKLSIH